MFDAQFISLPNRLDQHAHSHWQLVLPQRGEVAFNVAHGAYDLVPSQALILASDEPHAFEGYAHNQLLLINVQSPQLQDGWAHYLEPLTELFEQTHRLCLRPSQYEWIQLTIKEIERFMEPDSKLAVTPFYWVSILQSIALTSSQQSQTASSWLTSLGAQEVSGVIDYIHDHIGDALRVDELAKLMLLSHTQFHKRFREATGFSPHQYILNVRLDRAKELIQSSSKPLSDIAFELGFSSQSALSNAVKRRWGVTPLGLKGSK